MSLMKYIYVIILLLFLCYFLAFHVTTMFSQFILIEWHVNMGSNYVSKNKAKIWNWIFLYEMAVSKKSILDIRWVSVC